MASGLGTPQLTQPGGGAGLTFCISAARHPASRGRPSPSCRLPPASRRTRRQHDDRRLALPGRYEPVVSVQVGITQFTAADFSVSDASRIAVTFPAAADVIPPNDQTDGAGRVPVTVTLQDGVTSTVNVEQLVHVRGRQRLIAAPFRP